jgi:hypothetical protein
MTKNTRTLMRVLGVLGLVMFGPISKSVPLIEIIKPIYIIVFYLTFVKIRINKTWYFVVEGIILLSAISVFIIPIYKIQFIFGTISLGTLFAYFALLLILLFFPKYKMRFKEIGVDNKKDNILNK